MRTLFLTLSIGLLAACESTPCDEGYEFDGGVCSPVSEVDDLDTEAPLWPEAFGDYCESDDDCGDAATFCAINPGSDGYCTAEDCLEDDGVCPEDWGCMDVSIFDPSLTSICTMP